MDNASKYQTEIFNWVTSGRGHAVVNAAAGSGKTTTLVEACKLMRTDRALFCAFNKHIQAELSARFPRNVTVKTIHGIGYATLAREFGRLKVDDNKYEDAIERESRRYKWDATGVLRKLVHFARVSLTPCDNLDHMAEYYGIDVEDWSGISESVRWIIDGGTRHTETIDFDDMIYLPAALGLKPSRYDWVCVDEAQDLSAAQRSLVIACLAPGGRMLAVGDPWQSIQGFAGADPESFGKLRQGLDAIELPLSVCYRCPPNVISKARQIVPTIESAPGKPDGLIASVRLSDVAAMVQEGDVVICRKTAPCVRLCLSLIVSRVPARVKGRDIGAGLARDVRMIGKMSGFSMAEFGVYADRWAQDRVAKLRSRKYVSDSQIEAVYDRMEGLIACHDAFSCDNIESLARSIIDLFSDDRRSVTLSTIHRAKGLEADRVFILDYASLPMRWRNMQEWEIYQEDCLHYVALTRTKRELYLVD